MRFILLGALRALFVAAPLSAGLGVGAAAGRVGDMARGAA